MAKNKGKEFYGPKSICQCEHTGDGEKSAHFDIDNLDVVLKGKGPCSIKGCNCKRFTWKQFTQKYQHFLGITKGGEKNGD